MSQKIVMRDPEGVAVAIIEGSVACPRELLDKVAVYRKYAKVRAEREKFPKHVDQHADGIFDSVVDFVRTARGVA